jgi:membrane associated rhomboid family serine protease
MELPRWTDRLEASLGDWAIPHIVRGLVLLNVLAYFMEAVSPGFAQSLLLSPGHVFNGEVWRTITFLFVPTAGQGMLGPLFLLLFFLFMWFVGDALENSWGSFKLTLFLVLGILSINTFSLLTGITGTNIFFLQSFLFCFAVLFPNQEIMLFPIPIPVKVKYIGMFFAVILLLTFLFTPGLRLLILASLIPFFLYVGPAAWSHWQSRREAKKRRERFQNPDS